MGFSSNLRDAREAAGKLGADLKALHPGQAREEYEKVLERSRSLLTQIEQLQHAAPEAVSAALHKLRMAQGKLSRAVREERERSSSASSLLTGLQLSKSIPASASFQDADNLLAQALAELRSVSTGASSSSGALSPTVGDRQQLQLPQQLQQQQGLDEGPEQTGVLTRYMTAIGPLSSRSIATISLQPGPEGTVGSLCVVVQAPRSVQLDVYVGCKASNLKSKSMGSKKVNCMTHDRLFGVTWTGHADGTVRLHRVAESGALDYKLAEGHCVVGVAVRSMAVECHNDISKPARCWVGDDDGRVCMLAWQDGNPQLLAQNTVLPSELHGPGPTLSAAFSLPHSKLSGTLMSSASTTSAAAPKGVPVLAMLCLGRTMITSGGCCRPGSSTIHRLELWDCKHMSRLKEFSCTEMGAATSLELLDGAPEPQSSGALLTPGSRTQSGMESVSSWHSSLGGWEVLGGGTRLLSGHSGGQVVLWRLQGRGSGMELQELAVIGDHRENRPIKGLFAFPEWQMLVVAHSSISRAGFSATSCLGKLSVMHLPTAAQLAEAEKRRRAAVATPHKVAQSTVNLEKSVIEAHAQPILSTSRLGNTIVTASTSTLRLWSPRQLAQEALKDGLAFTRVIRTGSGCSNLSLPEAPSPSNRPSDLTGPLGSTRSSIAADTTPFAVPLDSDTPPQLHHSQQATQRSTAPLQIPQVLGSAQGSHRQGSAQPSPASRPSGALAMASPGKAPEGGGSIAASPGSSLTPWMMRQASTSHQQASADPFAAAAAAGPVAAAAGPAPAGSGAAAAGAGAVAAAAVAGGNAATLFQFHSAPPVDPFDWQQQDTPIVAAAGDASAGADRATGSSRTADRADGTAAAGAAAAAASDATAQPAQAPQQQAGGQQQAQQQKQRLKPQLSADAAASQTITCAADVEADAAADLAAHCAYQLVKQLQDPPMFGSSRALQVHCNRTNRLRTVLQIPRAQLQQLDSSQQQQLVACLEETSGLHHPHTLQVHEVFVTPLHLNIVLEECSAGRLTDFASKQHSMWGPAGAKTATGAAGAALSPEFARWFFQQVVLAVDYYHTYISGATEGSTAAARSRLSVQDTLLKVVPLPQPVVKVPTVLLARGLDAVDLVSSSSSFDRDFIPPEALQPLHSGAARHDTPVGDVWACGVLLLKLLGGTLQQDVYSKASSPSTEAATAEQLFTLPGTSGYSGESLSRSLQGNTGLLELLTAMLQPQVSHRLTLEQLQQHSWFLAALPPTAKTMTRRFMQLGTQTRPGQQPQDEIKAAVLAAAAAVGPQRQQQLIQALQQNSHVQQQRGLLQGPASAELLATLQLQLQALKRACAQLMSISTATLQGSSATKLTELLVTQQALSYAANTYQGLEHALISLQRLWRLQQMHLALMEKHRGMAILLQSSTAEALYSVNKLLQLLRGVQEPQQWRELQHSIPAQGKRSLDSRADPAALERLGWLLQLQVYLLAHAHQALHSLWCCSEAAAAIKAACTRATGGRAGHAPAALATSIVEPPSKHPTRVTAAAGSKQPTTSIMEPSSKQPTGVTGAAAAAAGSKQPKKQALGIHIPKPHILTAVMGPSMAAQIMAGAGALLMLQLPRHTPFVLSHAVLCLYVLLLVRLNDGMLSQQQQTPLPGVTRMRVDRSVEDMDYVAVRRQPVQGTPASSCVVYEGKMTPSQQQQEGSEVWVVALSQLVPSDTNKGLPPERVAVRRKRQEMRLEEELRHKGKERGYLCPICQGVMQDPVYFDDGYTYCKACIEAHILLKMKEGVEGVPSPMTLQPIHDTSLKRIHNLRSDITTWLEAERARQQQEVQQEQQQKRGQAVDSELDQACDQTGLAYAAKSRSSAAAHTLQQTLVKQEQQREQQQQQRGQAADSAVDQACDHMGLAHAAQPRSSAAARSLQQTLVKLQDAKLLSSSAAAAASISSSSSGRSPGQLIPPLAPIHGVCLDPPLLVLPRPAGGTLQQWISTAADSVSRTVSSAGSDFTAAWVAAMPWPLLLQLLGDVAAGVSVLHQQQPTVVHGGVHAAAVHLLQQLPDLSTVQQQAAAGVPGRVCQLSLVGLLNQLAPISSCHPFLAAPETVLATGPATAAADVYGLGVLMFQLASGWLPQQYTPGTDEQIAAVCWCRDMMAQYGSTSLLAAQHQQQQAGTSTAPWTPYGRHLLSAAALQLLPPGYVELMEQCLHRMPPARPCVEEIIARLQQLVDC